MTQSKSQRIHKSNIARTRRRKTKDIIYTKTQNFFRKRRWIRTKKQKLES